MPVLGGIQLTPRVGDMCSVNTCNRTRGVSSCKAVGGFTVYFTLCYWCYKEIQKNLEVTVLLLLVDEEEAIVGQVMNE